jgi:hypothetical protein
MLVAAVLCALMMIAGPAPVDVHIGTIEIVAEPAPAPTRPSRGADRPSRPGLDRYAGLRRYDWGG